MSAATVSSSPKITEKMARESPAEQAQVLVKSRICNPNFIFSIFSNSPDSNYSKLKYIISSSLTEACNNSVLLLGPRGCGKVAILELVLEDLLEEYPDMISVIKLNGLLHCDHNCALKEISRQLCQEHQLLFSKMASFDDNAQFMVSMLRECGLAHKTIIFVLDEFDLFAQGKQLFLYSLLDAMQSVTSQAVVIGISCRLKIFADYKFKEIVDTLSYSDSTVNHLQRFLFSTVSHMDLKSGLLSLENFKAALSTIQRQPKLEVLKDCSILELYILVCMKRLEAKEQELRNFNAIMKEYKSIHDTFQTSNYYARNVCLRAFEHLLQRELISFEDNRGHGQSAEFRPVKLLISRPELYQGLKSYPSCPTILHKLMDRDG
ncbi:origin of replication complex subunit 4 isoform X6 [Olea europaea var. sylvestris]|uniref:origin of replication complex subunit 4 isoform X6 n=1 Tax=Olea europaea var. sylvestris TaxID=158386 RepID=UPI000C1D4B69|nr:origin of replication complex subunit 4 isoform X6 [Olea europaea var. sylvestris]